MSLTAANTPWKVDAEVLVKTFVFGADKCFYDYRRDFFVRHRTLIFAKILPYQFTVCTVKFRSNGLFRVMDARQTGRFTKQPKEVDVYHEKVDKKSNKERGNR